MILYNNLIQKLADATTGIRPQIWKYDSSNTWQESPEYEFLMKKDTACELGGSKAAANMLCVTTDSGFFDGDQVLLYGPDLSEIAAQKGQKEFNYVRITLLLTTDIEGEEDDSDMAYRAIKNMDYVKYHLFPTGFMLRTAGQGYREQVRVSNKAMQQGISFEKVGNLMIRRYKEDENVRAAKVIFVTSPQADFRQLTQCAQKAADITRSLNKIIEGMPSDCDSCGIREICDEVEGLRELHFGRK